MISSSANFTFLEASSAQLARLGALPEWSLHVDPPTSILKIRQFTEELARLVAARQDALSASGEGFAEILTRLQRAGLLPTKAADVFHHLGRLGNVAAQENKGTAAQALSSLKLPRELGVWFHRAFADPSFAPPPFSPPEPPRDVSEELAHQLDELRSKLAETEDAAARAAREAEDART
ncbi:hypothetical protein [Hansschlegelia sp. KR7-227]|uniref:hypothetical protein n=1 Tax=Hansschlegelia sp. KR7-227 TaxID=3400914 RepID=UPI003C07F92C